MSLIIALKNGLYTSPQKYCLLTIGINTVAMIKNLEQNFKIFDAHSHSFRKCTLFAIYGIKTLLHICKFPVYK